MTPRGPAGRESGGQISRARARRRALRTVTRGHARRGAIWIEGGSEELRREAKVSPNNGRWRRTAGFYRFDSSVFTLSY